MSKIMGNFNKKFNIKELLIYETEYWIWSLKPVQTILGAGILSLKRECATLGELVPEEFTDLSNIINIIEQTLKKAFNYDIINYFMLMMVDKQVHYHVIPRYKNQVELLGAQWKDTDGPGIPNLAGETLEINKLVDIFSYIRSNLNI